MVKINWDEHQRKLNESSLSIRKYCDRYSLNYNSARNKLRKKGSVKSPPIAKEVKTLSFRRGDWNLGGSASSDSLDDIVFYGDPHGDFTEVNRIIKEKRPATLFILGDITKDAFHGRKKRVSVPLLNNSGTKIYGISGNHDDGMPVSGVEYIDWRVVTVNRIKFLGVPHLSESKEIESFLMEQKGIDVILSHYPAINGERFLKRKNSSTFMTRLYSALGAKLYIHGHFHNCPTCEIDGPYAGVESTTWKAPNWLPSVNTTESAITLGLNRIYKSKSACQRWVYERLVGHISDVSRIAGERACEHLWRREMAAIDIIDKTKKQIVNDIKNSQLTYQQKIDREFIAIKAIKIQHSREWLLIDQDNQITDAVVSARQLGCISRHEVLFSSGYNWEGASSKERFNQTYLIKLRTPIKAIHDDQKETLAQI